MTISPGHSKKVLLETTSNKRHNERGAALAIALLLMILLLAIAMGVMAVVQGEAKISSGDLKRTEACYASAAAMEIMTNNFSALFAHTSRPTTAELDEISDTPPPELTNPSDPNMLPYTFPDHTLVKNDAAILAMGSKTTVNIPNGPFGGLIAGVVPYRMTTTAQSTLAQCKLTRDMNNYLIPLFQFGMFSDKDIELHPGPAFTFNGRVHANRNIYVNGNVKFLDKVTTANEFIYDALRNGSTRNGANVSMDVGAINVRIRTGSMIGGPGDPKSPIGGPNLATADDDPVGQRGYFPDSPTGVNNPNWNVTSVAAAVVGVDNRLGGKLLTRTTGGAPLKLPLQLDGSPTRELIKRKMPNDIPASGVPSALSQSRYHSKAKIRILIDDEDPLTPDGAGIPAGDGVRLSTFDPIALPALPTSADPLLNGGGRALWRILDNNTLFSNSYAPINAANPIIQQQQNGAALQAYTVRGVRAAPAPVLKNITNASGVVLLPIRITSNGHGYATGDQVVVTGVNNNTGANNTNANPWTITRINGNIFSLNGSSSNATVGNAGTVYSYTALYALYNAFPKASNLTNISPGAGITGRILIQIVNAAGAEFDVTRQILSMGVTEGEPNSIIQLQRPLWAAFTQGSRDASAGANQTLTDIFNNTSWGADGQVDLANLTLNVNGYLQNIANGAAVVPRSDIPQSNALLSLMSGTAGPAWPGWHSIVPINVYNMREGHLTTGVVQDRVYERGITSIVQINMKNLARWIDGVYDNNLLATTDAVSGNIAHTDGYTVYVSDRRGDKTKYMTVPDPGSKPQTSSSYYASNGMVDNLDIYGIADSEMDDGEDVQNSGLVAGDPLGATFKDITELPDPLMLATVPAYGADTLRRTIAVAAWANVDPVTPTNHRYFRSALRLFNGETLQVTTSAARRLLTTHGLTIATENMVYIWGNYNTTGINQAPAAGVSSLNSSTADSHYCPGTGPALSAACASLIDTQVPASIVADAFFPLSKTWFDAESARFLADYRLRRADRNLPVLPLNARAQAGTSVRAGIIAGNNLGALENDDADCGNGNDSRLNGGIHNFPRFLEDWLVSNGGPDTRSWNFVGSFVPLYNSTQAMGQWWYITDVGGAFDVAIYGAPLRNWSFDSTFLKMEQLPPGTPMFQYIAPTAFRQVL